MEGPTPVTFSSMCFSRLCAAVLLIAVAEPSVLQPPSDSHGRCIRGSSCADSAKSSPTANMPCAAASRVAGSPQGRPVLVAPQQLSTRRLDEIRIEGLRDTRSSYQRRFEFKIMRTALPAGCLAATATAWVRGMSHDGAPVCCNMESVDFCSSAHGMYVWPLRRVWEASSNSMAADPRLDSSDSAPSCTAKASAVLCYRRKHRHKLDGARISSQPSAHSIRSSLMGQVNKRVCGHFQHKAYSKSDV